MEGWFAYLQRQLADWLECANNAQVDEAPVGDEDEEEDEDANFMLKLSTLEIPFFDLELLCRHTDLFHGGEEFFNCDDRQLRQFSLMFLKVRAQH